MTHWLVSHLPAGLILPGIIIVVVAGALLIQRFVRHRFTRLKQDAHNDATRFAFGVVSFVYAFFIGFVVSAMWGQVSTADANVRTEGAAGVVLARTSTVFDEVDRERIRQSLLDYERAALTEWPLAASGESYPEANVALERLYTAYKQVQPTNETQKTFLVNSFAALNDITEARTVRVLQARTDTGPSWALWAVIFLTSGLVLGCAIVYGVEGGTTHYLMVATVGVLVAANLFLVLELSHPYAGELSTSPEPLREVIDVLSAAPG